MCDPVPAHRTHLELAVREGYRTFRQDLQTTGSSGRGWARRVPCGQGASSTPRSTAGLGETSLEGGGGAKEATLHAAFGEVLLGGPGRRSLP